MEIAMQDQMVVFVDNFSLLDCLVFAGTTTAMLKVMSDIQFSCDRKLMTVLLLLDFCKAFENFVHCSFLCSKLSSLFRIHGAAVELIISYLSDRYTSVSVWMGRYLT
jgi:hypothetical protein